MKNPCVNSKLARLVWTGLTMLTASALAESPENEANKKSTTRPQVIYHLPPASSNTLHSQAKGQNNDSPVDSGTPSSVQRSRENADAAAQQQQTPAPPPPREREVKRQAQSNRSQAKPRSFKGQGSGKSHGKQSRKK